MIPINTVSTSRRHASDFDQGNTHLKKKINDERDVAHFKTRSLGFKNISTYIDLLCEQIYGTANKVLDKKYVLRNAAFAQCSDFLTRLEKSCDETDLSAPRGPGTLRFGHVAFRDWFDQMKTSCRQFVFEQLVNLSNDEQFKEELCYYLSESFGNRMRIDYGTGHELNFMIFTMGLSNLAETHGGDEGCASRTNDLMITPEKLKIFVDNFGWDVHALFAHSYLRLCRRLQTKFRLEPAGSRGVYNMDDFQFLPFLFGAAQLAGTKYISSKNFYDYEQVDSFKREFIFFDAVDFILNNKRGPFNEHSYTLWNYSSLGSWDAIYKRIKSKFRDDILSPFPIIQHILFGKYVLVWNNDKHV